MNINPMGKSRFDRRKVWNSWVKDVYFKLRGVTVLLICVAILIFAQGCIPVFDLGEYWQKGTIDPALEGHWKMRGVRNPSQDEFISFIKSGDLYLEETTQATNPKGQPKSRFKTRTLTLGAHMFLMYGDLDKFFDGASDPGKETRKRGFKGGLFRYAITDGTLNMYVLKDGILAKAIESGQVAGMDDDYMPLALAKLDEKTIAFVMRLADQPGNWKEPKSYERVQDLQKALELSNTYPATENTPRNSAITIHFPEWHYLAEDRQRIVFRQLRANPEWCVFKERAPGAFKARGEIDCQRRQKKGSGWTSRDHGYIARGKPDEPDWLQTSAHFQFGGKGGVTSISDTTRIYLSEAGPLEGDIHLKLHKTAQGIESCVMIGEPGLWFEFFEQSQIEDRVQTRKALAWLGEFLKAARENEKEILSRGYAEKLMPPGAIQHGEPTLEVRNGFETGMYDIDGWVNPGKPGYVYVKIFNTETGVRLSEENVTAGSNELTGWAAVCGALFYYEASNVLLLERAGGPSYTARFELWFDPDDGGKETKLVETTRDVNGFQKGWE